MKVRLTEVQLAKQPLSLQGWRFYKVSYEEAKGAVVWEGTLWLPSHLSKDQIEKAINARNQSTIRRCSQRLDKLGEKA